MVVQIAGIVMLPIIMLIVAASPFDEPISIEPVDKNPVENSQSVIVVFFIIWMIWVLLLTRILYQVKKGIFKIKK